MYLLLFKQGTVKRYGNIYISHKEKYLQLFGNNTLLEILTLSTMSLCTQRRTFRSQTPQYIHPVTMPPKENCTCIQILHTVSNNRVNCPFNHYANVYFI